MTTVEQTKIEIEHKLVEPHKNIKMLNSKTKEDLEEIHTHDRTCTVMEVKRVLTA